MPKAKEGDSVTVHYTGRLEDETVFDSSRGRGPLSFELGSGQIIPGFERAVMGMAPGETKTFTIPSEEAYGPRREDQIVEVDRSILPEDIDPSVGQQLKVQQANGATAVVRVQDITESTIVLDANHPLAGKDLTFEVELIEVEESEEVEDPYGSIIPKNGSDNGGGREGANLA